MNNLTFLRTLFQFLQCIVYPMALECVSIGEEVLLIEIFESEVLEQFTEQDAMTVPQILVKQLLKEVSKAEVVALIEEMSKDSGN